LNSVQDDVFKISLASREVLFQGEQIISCHPV